MTEDLNRPAGDPSTLGQGGDRPDPVVLGGPPAAETAPPASASVRTSMQRSGAATQEDPKETAKREAAQTAETAKEDAKQVGRTAKEEASRTAGEAKRQAKSLLRQGQSELNEQTDAQQQRLAEGLRTFSSELDQMADGAEHEGLASHAARWAAEMSGDAGRWLEDRDPSDVVDEIKRFARRRPGTFILAAAGAGLVVGRIARSLRDEASDDDGDPAVQPRGTTARPSYATGSSPSSTPGSYPPPSTPGSYPPPSTTQAYRPPTVPPPEPPAPGPATYREPGGL